jgi:hypothetical protein
LLEEFQDNDIYKICNPENNSHHERPESALDLSHCHSISEEQTTINVQADSFKIHVKWEETTEQVYYMSEIIYYFFRLSLSFYTLFCSIW